MAKPLAPGEFREIPRWVSVEQWSLMVKEMERVQQAVRQLYVQQPWGGPPPDFYDGAIKERMEAMRNGTED